MQMLDGLDLLGLLRDGVHALGLRLSSSTHSLFVQLLFLPITRSHAMAVFGIIHRCLRKKTDAHTYPSLTRAEADAWRDLHRQLAKTRTLQDAKEVAAQTAPPHARRFYAHLRSFVRTLKLPRHSTRSELYVYGKLRLRFARTAAERHAKK